MSPDEQFKILNPLPRLAKPPIVNMANIVKDYHQVVVFGVGGVGKTDFGLRSTPKPIIWIDADARANTIVDKFNDGRIWVLFQPTTQEELENSVAHAIYYLQEYYNQNRIKGTIVLDSYTAAKTLVRTDYLLRQNRPADSKLSIDDKSNIKRAMLRIVNNLKYCKFNLVVTAEQGIHIISEENQDTGKARIADVIGNVPKDEDELMYFCDYLLNIYRVEQKREGANDYVTRYLWKLYKSSTSRLPQEVDIASKEDIDWEKMIAELKGLQRAELKRMGRIPDSVPTQQAQAQAQAQPQVQNQTTNQAQTAQDSGTKINVVSKPQ